MQQDNRGEEKMSWEKLNLDLVAKPAQHGGGLYLRIPKKIASAYELYSAELVEFTIKRVRRSGSNEFRG